MTKKDALVVQMIVALKLEEEKPRIVTGHKSLAKVLGLSARTIMRYKKAGQIPHKSIGRKIFYNVPEVIKAMEVSHG